jgi:hypothetical protein|nr:MAG TPA: hypothetical protein [Caudoviricetes sp.]
MENDPNYIVISIDDVAEKATLAMLSTYEQTEALKVNSETVHEQLKQKLVDMMKTSDPEQFVTALARDITMDLIGAYEQDEKNPKGK